MWDLANTKIATTVRPTPQHPVDFEPISMSLPLYDLPQCQDASQGRPECARFVCQIYFIRNFFCFIGKQTFITEKTKCVISLFLSGLAITAEAKWGVESWVPLFFQSWFFFSPCLTSYIIQYPSLVIRICYQVQFSSSHLHRFSLLTSSTPATFGRHKSCYHCVTYRFSSANFGLYYHRYHRVEIRPTPKSLPLCDLPAHCRDLWPTPMSLPLYDLLYPARDLWLTPT